MPVLVGIVSWTLCLGGVAESMHASTVANSEKQGSEEAAREYEIKGAFLLSMIKFTKWPKNALGSSKGPIKVLIIGNNPFEKTLEDFLKTKDAHGRKFSVSYAKSVPTKLDAHVVFIKDVDDASRNKLIKQCHQGSILLVGDRAGLAKTGVCIGFYLDNRRVRFEVNVDALKQSQLSASSELLKVARIVKGKTSADDGSQEDRGIEGTGDAPPSKAELPQSPHPVPPPPIEFPSSNERPAGSVRTQTKRD
ncbi:MAG: hypothetical protein ACI841_004171 [Planctomycetota bacterium]|jgi:hypothetical protein